METSRQGPWLKREVTLPHLKCSRPTNMWPSRIPGGKHRSQTPHVELTVGIELSAIHMEIDGYQS